MDAGTLHFIDDALEPPLPGRPSRPRLVSPSRLASRGAGSVRGRAALLHAVAHIEFNAIDLAWDAVCRFKRMPPAFYLDWARVAVDEARHFHMLCTHLACLGFHYGDFDAHDGLWEAAERTAGDCMVRMALVPRVLEARGLDVAPGMIRRLRASGDERAANILEVILEEEVAHVAVGTRWFRHLCVERGLEPDGTFVALVTRLMPGAIRPPFHHDARRAAGFTDQEMHSLEKNAGQRR